MEAMHAHVNAPEGAPAVGTGARAALAAGEYLISARQTKRSKHP